jgi:hypothetical protein
LVLKGRKRGGQFGEGGCVDWRRGNAFSLLLIKKLKLKEENLIEITLET